MNIRITKHIAIEGMRRNNVVLKSLRRLERYIPITAMLKIMAKTKITTPGNKLSKALTDGKKKKKNPC